MLEESRLPSLRSMVISVNWSPGLGIAGEVAMPPSTKTMSTPCFSGSTSKGRLAKLSDSSNSSIVSVGSTTMERSFVPETEGFQ